MIKHTFKSVTILFASFLLLLNFSACKTETKINLPTSGAEREITDDLGRKVKIPVKIDRIVSLAPNLTENIFAVGAGNKLVGVTTYCNYPQETQAITKIGDTINPNLEKIISLKPNVVFVSTASQIEAFTKTLEQQNIAVFVTNPKDIEGVYKSLNQIGDIVGETEKANQLVDALKKRVADVETRTKSTNPVKVFVQISKDQLFTIGKASFMTDLVNRAGGVSVTANIEEAYPKFSKETALALQPEAIILSESDDNREPNDVFKNSPAVKNGKVFKISADLISRPGPRIIDGLEQIAKALHPF